MSDEHWFEYHDERLGAFYHMYNLTHLNERMVEMAIATSWMDRRRYQSEFDRFLEVGNVTGHYAYRRHRVFDLHEEASWYQTLLGAQQIIPVDILEVNDWESIPQFKSVLSISTIEHTADPVAALAGLSRLVEPGGQMLVTFPTGVRPQLDMIATYHGSGIFDRFCTISRDDNAHGGWSQDPEPVTSEYGPWANTVCVGEWTAP